MLRFPNPGSNIGNLIRIYNELYFELLDNQPFSFDDISYILAVKNLATSSGYMGKEALKRSTREDRTRDPMFNQSKMYAETFRFLGWIHPTEGSNSDFQFTYFGAHVTHIMRDPKPFMRECLIGIAYPTETLDVRGTYVLRPFFTILKTLRALGGYMSRDEMIIGPLSLDDDTSDDNFNAMVARLKDIRVAGADALQSELEQVTGSTGKILSKATRSNNTRFPLAALLWSDWTIVERKKVHYGRSQQYHCLTDFGKDYIDALDTAIDIRNDDMNNKYYGHEKSLIRLSFYQTLQRGGFDISSEIEELTNNLEELQSLNSSIEDSNIIFSPYQEIKSKSTYYWLFRW